MSKTPSGKPGGKAGSKPAGKSASRASTRPAAKATGKAGDKASGRRARPGVVPVLVKAADDEAKAGPPVLKAVAIPPPRHLSDHELAALKAELVAVAWEVVVDLLHSAVREVEAALFEQVSSRLREELPVLVERALRNHLRT
jgi:hypothetical protein